MSNIKWEEENIHGCELNAGVISFLGDEFSNPNRISGTLEASYGTIDFHTGSIYCYDRYSNPCPLDVIREYEKKMTDALDSVASLRVGAGETDYDVRRDDPDLRLADLYKKTYRDIDETLGKQIRELDDFWLYFNSDSSRLEGFEEGSDCLGVIGVGLEGYSIDLESLTVGNWNHKLEETFKTAAEDLLNELRDASSVKEIVEKCKEHFDSVCDDDIMFY